MEYVVIVISYFSSEQINSASAIVTKPNVCSTQALGTSIVSLYSISSVIIKLFLPLCRSICTIVQVESAPVRN